MSKKGAPLLKSNEYCVCSVEEFRAEGQPEQELFCGGATREVWGRCSVAALFGAGTDVAPVLARLEALLGLQQPLRFEAGCLLSSLRSSVLDPGTCSQEACLIAA